SQQKQIAKDASDGIGIIHERKRLCVAISRAQELLIVVGNLSLLFNEDATWRQLLTIAARNDCLTGIPIKELTTKEQID
ncbi:AAA domain-containing protein, partial [Klebsiella pneumoniae]|nr:AAA domain-containing protein [Klebsiella pneumoniae]